jgi:hypothetical protein
LAPFTTAARPPAPQDELLCACLELLLHAPAELLDVQRLGPPLQQALALGLQYLPLAKLVQEALVRWEAQAPAALAQVLPQVRGPGWGQLGAAGAAGTGQRACLAACRPRCCTLDACCWHPSAALTSLPPSFPSPSQVLPFLDPYLGQLSTEAAAAAAGPAPAGGGAAAGRAGSEEPAAPAADEPAGAAADAVLPDEASPSAGAITEAQRRLEEAAARAREAKRKVGRGGGAESGCWRRPGVLPGPPPAC